MKYLAVGSLSLGILYLQAKLWVGANSIPELWRLQRQVNAQVQEIATQRARSQVLEDEIQLLKRFPEALEEHARSELGMIRSNETFCLVLEPVP